MANDMTVTNDTTAFLAVLEKLAANPEFEVAKLQAMLDMQKEIMRINAENSFNQAMARLQSKIPQIHKGKKGHTNNYATYEDIDFVVRPLMSAEGFSASYSTEPRQTGGCFVVCTLRHVDGHKEVSKVEMALDGGKAMNNLQGMGSSMSYGKRYALCNALNIVTTDEDDDGAKGGGIKYITNEQAVDIDLKIRALPDAKEYLPKFLNYMKTSSLTEILSHDYGKAMTALSAKTGKK